MNQVRRVLAIATVCAMFTLSGCTYLGRVNVPTSGSGPVGVTTVASTDPAISSDGGVVAFASAAANLVAGDLNSTADVFVRDGNTTERVSLTNAGGESAGVASAPAVSADGRYVAFVSTGSDLVAGDTNGSADVFVRDRDLGTTERVSLTNAGGESAGVASAPAVSADGRYVAFVSTGSDLVAGDANGAADVFVRDRDLGTTTRVSVKSNGGEANGASSEPSISPAGEWVAYTSDATNLVSGDGNSASDVFLSARAGGNTTRASVPDTVTRPFQESNGASSQPEVSDNVTGYLGDGAPLVVFASEATNLEGSDANGGSDVFVTTGVFGGVIKRTLRLSATSALASAPSLAVLDGGPRFVVAYVSGDNVVSVERDSPVDLGGVQTRTVSVDSQGGPANGPSATPAVSDDGQFVAFASTAGNLDGRNLAPNAGDIRIGRATAPTIDSVSPDRLGLLETRDVTITGRNFAPNALVVSLTGVQVNSTTFVSSGELIANITATVDAAAQDFHTISVATPGRGGIEGLHIASCEDCVEIAAVVEQPGDVDIEITEIAVEIGGFELATPSCILGACPAIPGTVSVDGDLDFGLDSIDLDPIEIPVELIAGVEVNVGVVPRFVAPSGTVIPANGAIDLGFGFAIGLVNPLLPSSCAIGPVQASLSAGPGGDPLGVAYDQNTGTATLRGGFTEELEITGCGFFTGALNAVFGFPIPIAENQLVLSVQLDPVLTGTVVP